MRGMLIMFCSTTAAAGTFVCVLAARRMVDRGTLLTISGVLLGMLAQLALFGLILVRRRKEERGMPETWVHRYCYRDKSGQVVVVSKTVKRPRWPGRPRHKGRGKVYGQARG